MEQVAAVQEVPLEPSEVVEEAGVQRVPLGEVGVEVVPEQSQQARVLVLGQAEEQGSLLQGEAGVEALWYSEVEEGERQATLQLAEEVAHGCLELAEEVEHGCLELAVAVISVYSVLGCWVSVVFLEASELDG